MEKEPITIEGLKKLKVELEELKNVKRPKIVEAIAEARGHGDLKENAEYHAAKEEQAKIEGRIISINDSIARANVIDVTALEKKDSVIFGSTVELKDLENNEKKTYKIVGKEMTPWLGDVTDDVDIMMCSDKILTLVETHKSLVDSYLKLATE